MMSTFKLEISTPEAEFLSVDAEAVTMSSRKGSMTVLPGHAPMLVALTPGEINVKVEVESFSFHGRLRSGHRGSGGHVYPRGGVGRRSRGSQKRKRKAGGARAHPRSEEYIRA